MRSDRTVPRANPLLREIQIFIISIFPAGGVLERELKENRITETMEREFPSEGWHSLEVSDPISFDF